MADKPAGSVRVVTFNVENLACAYRFRSELDPDEMDRMGWRIEDTRFQLVHEDSKALSGRVLREIGADVVCLQEVEGMDVLRRFRSDHLGGRSSYPHAALIDGNDPRRIDVAVLSKLPITHIRTWAHLYSDALKNYVFLRDCLEVEIACPFGPLTLYVNHLKSMRGGRRKTRRVRRIQCRAVLDIVKGRFGENAGRHPFAIVGDMNDYLDPGREGESGIAELVRWDQVENLVDRMPEQERWTHHWKGDETASLEPEYKALDRILLSKLLAETSPGAPGVIRRGLPLRAGKHGQYEEVGLNHPKASDHCPLWFDIVPPGAAQDR